jgi:hypothetical protein
VISKEAREVIRARRAAAGEKKKRQLSINEETAN